MRIVLVAVLAFLPTSCVSYTGEAKPFTAPDGRPAYLISCGGMQRTIAACHDKAREICGGNYAELNRSVSPRETGLGSTENRSIEIVCAS